MPPKPPRRTRERILETALAMFNQFGEPTVATPSIAFEMGISPGNLYYHYHSKKAIVADLFAEFQREIETTLAAPEARLPNAEDCWLFLHLVFETIWKYRFICRDINHPVARYHVIEAQFRRILAHKTRNRFWPASRRWRRILSWRRATGCRSRSRATRGRHKTTRRSPAAPFT